MDRVQLAPGQVSVGARKAWDGVVFARLAQAAGRHAFPPLLEIIARAVKVYGIPARVRLVDALFLSLTAPLLLALAHLEVGQLFI